MTFVLYLVGLLFVGVIAVFVALPLLKRGVRESVHEPDNQTSRWEKQKTEAYAVIKEAEFDWQMGKLTEEDYRVLRHKYEARALEALAQLGELDGAETVGINRTT
jgi:hypothetical protein